MLARKIGPQQGLPGKPVGVNVYDGKEAHRAIDNAKTEPKGTQHAKGKRRPVLPGLSATHAAVGHAVVGFGGFGNGWCYASIRTLGINLKLSDSAVHAALTDMVAKGWLHADLHRATDQAGAPVGSASAWYRLTPVLADALLPEARTESLMQARDAAAQRKATQRAKKAAEAKAAAVSPLPEGRLSHLPDEDVPRPGRAEYPDPDPAGSGRTRQGTTASPDPDSATPHDSLVVPRQGTTPAVRVEVTAYVPRAARRPAHVATTAVDDEATPWRGMALPDPLPEGLHVAYAGVIALMLEAKLPNIDPVHAINIATRCSFHKMDHAMIGGLILYTRETCFAEATGRQLEAALQAGRGTDNLWLERGRRFFIECRDAAAEDDGVGVGDPVEPLPPQDHGVWWVPSPVR